MGLFRSKTKTQVGTVVSRVIQDNLLPDSVRSGIQNGLLRPEGNITDYMLEGMVGSLGIRAERMYDYAKDNYTYGMPSGQALSATQGLAQVTAVINAIEGSPVGLLINYSRFGPPNNLHIGWMKLIQTYNYNPVANTLPTLSTLKGNTVYLKDMVVVIPTSMASTIEPRALEQWGQSASSGYTPQRVANTGAINYLFPHSRVEIDPNAVEEYVRVTYVWQQTIQAYTGNYEETVTIPLSGYDDDADYFHVRYSYGITVKYWMYKIGTGTYPTLDALFNAPPVLTGTFFPFTYFRFNKIKESLTPGAPSYQTSKKMLKYIGIDFDDVVNKVNENPDIADVEQAMMVMAVPANSTNPLEQRYLFDFFDAQYYATGEQFTSVTQASISALLQDLPDVADTAMIIQDSRFKMALNNGGIYKKRLVGHVGSIGTYTSEVTTTSVAQQYWNGSTLVTYTTPVSTHIYKKQIGLVLYDEIRVYSLSMMYHIQGRYATTGDETDDILLIPIDHSITENYTIPEREEIYSRSLHYVFNSLVITKIKWYQTNFFKFFMIVVAILVTIFTYGTAWTAMATAIAAGGAAAVGLLTTIVLGLLEYILTVAAVNLFVKAVGLEAALIIAVIAALVGVGLAIKSGSLTGAPWATELLTLSTNLSSGAGREIKAQVGNLLGEANTFSQWITEQTKLLDAAQDLLEQDTLLSPYTIFGESPNDFYNRTVHSGNIGILGIGAVNRYVEVALTLPKLSETIGDSQNELHE